jgi:hypothetical protein
MAGGNHSWERCGTRHSSHLLPVDFSLPSAEVHPTTISKYNTALQIALIGATTAMPLVTVDVSAAMTAMQ